MFTSSHQWSADQTTGREEGGNLQWEMSGNAIIKQHQLPEVGDQGLLGLHAEFNRPCLPSENRASAVAMALDVIAGIVKPNSETNINLQ